MKVLEQTVDDTPNRSARSSFSKPNLNLISVNKNSSLWDKIFVEDGRKLLRTFDQDLATFAPRQYRTLGR